MISSANVSADHNQTESESSCGYEKHQWLEEKFFLMTVFGTMIAIGGIFGNLTTAVILSRPKMRSPNNLFLTALALFDTIVLITGAMLYSVEYLHEYSDNWVLYTYWTHYVPYVYSISHVSQTGSVYTTVAVTIERFLAMKHPRAGRKLCGMGGAVISIAAVTLFSVAFNFSKFWEVVSVFNPDCTDKSQWGIDAGPLGRDELYAVVHSLWLSNIVMIFLPFLILLVLNGLITSQLHKVKLRYRADGRSTKESLELKQKARDATLILVVIVLIFLICNFWGFVMTLMEHIWGANYLRQHWAKFYAFSRESINILAIINSSINFIIYCIFGKDFRSEVVRIYCCSREIPLMGAEDLFTRERFIPERDRGGALQRCARILRENPLLTPLLRVGKIPGKMGNGFQPGTTLIIVDGKVHSDPVLPASTSESQANLFSNRNSSNFSPLTSPTAAANGVLITTRPVEPPWAVSFDRQSDVFELIDNCDGVWETLL